jgi:hypothetical protein
MKFKIKITGNESDREGKKSVLLDEKTYDKLVKRKEGLKEKFGGRPSFNNVVENLISESDRLLNMEKRNEQLLKEINENETFLREILRLSLVRQPTIVSERISPKEAERRRFKPPPQMPPPPPIEWEQSKIKILKEKHKELSVPELAELLGTNTFDVKKKLKELNLTAIEWTDDEIKTLREFYKVLIISDLARKLKRDVNTVREKMKELGLKERVDPQTQTKGLLKELRSMFSQEGKVKKGVLKPPPSVEESVEQSEDNFLYKDQIELLSSFRDVLANLKKRFSST